jgi:hypothetical protein
MLGGLLGLARSSDAQISITSRTPERSHEAKTLEMRVDALELACAGLWRLLKEHHGYTDEQLVAWVDHVDQEDGKKDGKRTVKGSVCPHCGRPALTRARGKCLWCGAEVPRDPL